MVDFGQLSISDGLLVLRRGRGRVIDKVDVEDGADEAFRRAEGADDDAGVERLLGEEVLNREFFARLYQKKKKKRENKSVGRTSLIWTIVYLGGCEGTYDLNDCLSTLLDCKGKWSLETCILLFNNDKSLMRLLWLSVLLGLQHHFDGICCI